MQYENIFKVIGVVHVILAFLVLLLLLLKVLGRRLLRVLVLGLLRWINVYSLLGFVELSFRIAFGFESSSSSVQTGSIILLRVASSLNFVGSWIFMEA